MSACFAYDYVYRIDVFVGLLEVKRFSNSTEEGTPCDGDGEKINKFRNGCAQSTDYLNTSLQMMVMSPAAGPSGCPYVTKLQP